MNKHAATELKALFGIALLTLLSLFLFAGCDDDDGGPVGPGAGAWDRYEPLLEGNKIRGAFFVSADEGWLVGTEGVILHTIDGGNVWSGQVSGTDQDLWDVAFYDADTGWAVGKDGTLLRTNTGGVTWSPTLFDTIPGHIYGVAFEDGVNGWAVGEFGTIVRTTDAGRRWARVTSPVDVILRGVAVFGDVAVAVGDAGTVLRATKNTAWSDWTSQVIDTDSLRAVAMVSEATGWAVGDNGSIWKTDDGGVTWLGQTSGVSEDLLGLTFISATTGLVVGEDGTVLGTTDGQNWQSHTSPTWLDLFAVSFGSPIDVWAAGDLTILKSTSGGAGWTVTPSGTSPYTTLQEITFLDENLGWAVGNGAAILMTSDGGDSWTYLRRGKLGLPAEEFLYDVAFVDSLNGWCVGGFGAPSMYTGLLLRTTDGGHTWEGQSYDSTRWLYSITFADSLTGYAVGGDWTAPHLGALVVKTTDGGVTWNSLDIPTANQLQDVSFADTLNGWAVGYAATIIHTTDGGAVWEEQIADTLIVPILYAVAAVDSAHCWAVGREGSIFHTDNAGETWNRQTSNTNFDLTAVAFIDTSTAWAVGGKWETGIILRTDNAGATWQVQLQGGASTLLGVTFLDTDNGWAVGTNGLILSTNSGGR